MRILARAEAIAAQGRSVVNMVIGEPDLPSADPIVAAGIDALLAGQTRYAPDLGLPALRETIARSYAPEVWIDPKRVVVTPGASGALQLICAALVSPGDEVLMTDPGYPCNRNFVRMFEGVPVGVAVDAGTGFQLTPDVIRAHWTPRTVAVVVGSPSNPVGSVISDRDMRDIVRTVEELGGVLIVDEIYHGLIYDAVVTTSAALSDRVFIVNSFSKYHGMTGWRVGWSILPYDYIAHIEKLVQNIFIAASTPAQYAALAAFSPATRAELDRRRRMFRERRDYLVSALRELGFGVPVEPQGAFYVYADCSRLTTDSEAFAAALLEESGVAIAPGLDFGRHRCEQHVRFSYASSLEVLREGARRIGEFLARPDPLLRALEQRPSHSRHRGSSTSALSGAD
jgi:aspartate/methionine/tyrosine aminotransferase